MRYCPDLLFLFTSAPAIEGENFCSVSKGDRCQFEKERSRGSVATSRQDLIHTQGTFDPLGSEGSLIEMQKPKVKTM